MTKQVIYLLKAAPMLSPEVRNDINTVFLNGKLPFCAVKWLKESHSHWTHNLYWM